MPKKVNLPVLDEVFERARAEAPRKKPTLEAARQRLGGSAKTESAPPAGLAPGVVVGVAGKPAVVVFANADEVHVMVDARRLRKLTPSGVALGEGSAETLGDELDPIAADARVFGAMTEGDWIRYADAQGGAHEGKLVEKCRYGALVARSDGTIVAVGFRKLWPVAAAGDA